MGVANFNGGAKYEKQQILIIQNKALLNVQSIKTN